MNIDFASINWLAVAVAVIAVFLLGGIWYGVIFGKAWAQVHRYSDEQVKAMAKSQARTFGIFIIMDLLAVIVMSLFVANLEIHSLAGGLTLGFLLWLGFVLVDEAKQNAAHRRPMAAFLMDAGFSLLWLLTMGAIIGAWR